MEQEGEEGGLAMDRTPRPLKGKELSAELKTWLGKRARSDGMSVGKVAKEFGLSRTVIYKYSLRVKEGQPLYGKRGRPPLLDDVGCETVRRDADANLPTQNLVELVDKAVCNRAEELNRPLGKFDGVSRRTALRIAVRVGLRKETPKTVTAARDGVQLKREDLPEPEELQTLLKEKGTDPDRAPGSLAGKNLSAEVKTWLGKLARAEGMTAGKVAREFGLSRVTVNNYARRVQEGLPFYDMGGRPRLLDEQGCEDLRHEVGDVVPADGFRGLVNQAIQHRAEALNRPLGKFAGVCRHTARRIAARVGLRRQGQEDRLVMDPPAGDFELVPEPLATH